MQLLQELEAQQADELASSDASYQQALQQLLQVWDGRISELQALLQEAEQQLVARQVEEATSLLVSARAYRGSCS
jgi:CBS-domain-containing membrane protein